MKFCQNINIFYGVSEQAIAKLRFDTQVHMYTYVCIFFFFF